MRNGKLKGLLFISFIIFAQSALADMVFGSKVIYGDDNRLEYYQVPPKIQSYADATVSLFERNNVKTDVVTKVTTQLGSLFSDKYGLCAEEPFREQPTAAFCSGFLVGKDLIATAGHCIEDQFVCGDTTFVFGFNVKAAGKVTNEFPEKDVYKCKKLVARAQDDGGKDFAIIQLDRAVTGRQPLKLRRIGQTQVGDEITVMGHPAGIPLKIAGGATVRRVEPNFFVANLDTYGGNSGSAVVNLKTGEVEGILVRGEDDFEWKGMCNASKKCDDVSCRGEDVTWSSELLSYVPNL